MVKRKYLVRYVLVIAALVVAQIAPASLQAQTATDLQSQIDAKAKELERVNQQILQTQAVLSETEAQSKTLKQELGKIDTNIKSVNLGIQKSELLIDKLGLEINSLGQDIIEKEKIVEEKRLAVGSIIQTLQTKDNENLLITFLNNRSLAESLAEAQSLSDLNSELLGQVVAIRELKEQLLERRDQVTEKKGSVEVEHRTLQVQKSIAQEQREERAQILAKTQNQERIYQQTLSELEKQQQAISKQIDDIESQLRDNYNPSAAPSKRGGVLSFPLANPRITQEYGATAFAARAYKTQFHNGMDFAAPIGTPVLAAADGVVTTVGNNGRVQYGRYIVIKHGNNLSTLYGHLSRQAVTEGEAVKRGDIIGYSGNTGYSTGPHLHFTVYLTASIQLKSIAGAGIVPAGFTLNPRDYL